MKKKTEFDSKHRGKKNVILRWFKDQAFSRILKNASILFSGNLLTNVLGLISIALTARALGPNHFGILVLIQTYVRVVDVLFNFQSWQAIIKYGADSIEHHRDEDFKQLIKFGTYLDSGSALVATTVATLGVYWVAKYQQWTTEITLMAILYSLTILFNLSGTPTAVLRLYDRFKWLAMQKACVAALRMAAVIVLFLTKSELLMFVIVLGVMRIVEFVSVLALGWYELIQQDYHKALTAKIRGVANKYPGLWKFVLNTNLSSSIRLGAKEIDVLIVGGIAGTAVVSIYKIAKQFCTIPNQLADPIQQAIYPDLAKLWANGMQMKFQQYIMRIGILTGIGGVSIWFIFMVAGELILRLTVGTEYTDAASLLQVYMIANVIFLFGVAFRPAVLSMGHAERILLIYICGHVIYYPVLVWLLGQIGVMGAAVAQIFFHSFWFVSMFYSIVSFLRINFRNSIARTPT